MASVEARPTWAEYASLHAALGVVAVPICYVLAVMLRGGRSRTPFFKADRRLTRLAARAFMIFSFIMIVATLTLAIVNNQNHHLPHFTSAHSGLGILTVLLIVLAGIAQVVVKYLVEKRGITIGQSVSTALRIFFRVSIIVVTLATILTGVAVRCHQASIACC